jgi:hypothetical protein
MGAEPNNCYSDMLWPRFSLLRRKCWHTASLAAAMLFVGCANGDFGRVRSSLVNDDMHAWVGQEAPKRKGKPPSQFPLTDAERHLRDLAYPLIEPPYDRQRWYSALAEHGLIGVASYPYPDRSEYAARLMSTAGRSQNSRYSKLIEDVRNDVVRIDPFFAVARHVVDADNKRERILSGFAAYNSESRGDAHARIAENAAVIDWVNRSLCERVASYHIALEQLAIAAPSPFAAEVERALVLMQTRISAHEGIIRLGRTGTPCLHGTMAQSISK